MPRPGTPASLPPDGGHIAALDGVRALAILLVLGVHAGTLFEPTRGGLAVMHVFGYGWAGVDLFFVLSGMLITGILLDTKGAPGYYASFYARRALRIFPLYYTALFLLLIALPLAAAALHHRAPAFFASQGWLWTYTTNIAIARTESWSTAVNSLTFPYWSLAVEEQFYLVWPFVVAAFAPRALARVSGAMIVVALLLRTGLALRGGHTQGLYLSTPTRMDALAAGALLALAMRAPGGLARYRRYATPVLVACGLGLAGLFVVTKGNNHDAVPIATLGFTLIALGSAAFLTLVLTAGPDARLRRVLDQRWARHLGARSYGVYVWHVAVYAMVANYVLPRLTPLVPWSVVRGLVALAIATAATLATAEVSWVVLEAPILRLKRFVPRPQRRPASRAVDRPATAPASETAEAAA